MKPTHELRFIEREYEVPNPSSKGESKVASWRPVVKEASTPPFPCKGFARMRALTKKEQKLIDWLSRAEGRMLLESQVVASGMSKEINELILLRLITLDEHPSVKERTDPPIPATAVVLLKKP